ncbi:cupredoxin domain-containing protein [Candidatus Binatus sp.]|uniref:cupredoxin domain-containing protein n=1 Tax=Candidatus Binatus sp. TaxID=2811406 RepID=UPI003C71AB1C
MASSTIDLRIATAASRRPRSRLILRVAIVAAALAVAASLALLPNPAKAASSPIVIKMADKQPFYTPAKVTIKVGDTVQWVNGGATVHSVSTSAANAQNPKDTSMPKGATAFDSGFIPPGGDYSYTFTVPGTYRYFCVPHEKAGMVGVIVVKK